MSGSTRRVFYKAPIMNMEEEEEIVDYAIDRANKDVNINRGDVIQKVLEILKRENRKNSFRHGAPGDKWFHLVRIRHNDKFKKVDRSVLKLLESVGFTERVKITSRAWKTQSYSPGVTIKNEPEEFQDDFMIKSELKSPGEIKEDLEESSNMEDKSSNMEDNENTDFRPGSKLEVMDFNEKWYPVKVVEVDYEEGEVLVHFEKWSDRYDEWVPMDSNRIRKPTVPKVVNVKKLFKKNEKVIAVWAYNHKYPAVIKSVLADDRYEVLFSDGYVKILRGCKLFKATKEDLKNVWIPPPKAPAPPMGADPIDPNLGPKEERRLKKRKLDVLEAYLPQKRQRLDIHQSMSDTSLEAHSSSQSHMPQYRRKLSPAPSVNSIKKEINDDDDNEDEDKMWIDEDPIVHKKIRRKKKILPESTASLTPVKPERKWAYNKSDYARWHAEIPEGVVPVTITDETGHTRESIVVPDNKLPKGWSKHTMQRRTGAKWDVFLINSEGKKFRSRKELREYFNEIKQPFPDEQLDFTVGPRIEAARLERKRENLFNVRRHKHKIRIKISKNKRPRSPEGEVDSGSEQEKSNVADKSVKIKHEPETFNENSPIASSTPSQALPAFSFSEMKTSDGGYTCCGKNFRKESLLQMHLKHYHPEYSGLLGSSPNVADLAYARTVGTPVEDYSRSDLLTPRSSPSIRPASYQPPTSVKTESNVPTSLESSTTSTPVDKQTKDKVKLLEDIKGTVKDKIHNKEGKREVETLVENLKDTEDPSDGSVQGDELDSRDEIPSPPPSDESKCESSEEKSGGTPLSASNVEPVQKCLSVLTNPPDTEIISSYVPQPSPTQSLSSTLPIIKKLTSGSKSSVSSEALIVKASTSPKTPITITKYVPSSQKSTTTSTTKVTVSPFDSKKSEIEDLSEQIDRDEGVAKQNAAADEHSMITEGKGTDKEGKSTINVEEETLREARSTVKDDNSAFNNEGQNSSKDVKAKEGKSHAKENKSVNKEGKTSSKEGKTNFKEGKGPVKEVKGTIKTLLPMRPPLVEPKELPEEQKQRDKIREVKEESYEEGYSNKGRPRKRTVSDSMPRKLKLVKPSTGSLEEQTPDIPEPSTYSSNKSYRFSRNRTQLPRVSLKKLELSNRNGAAEETLGLHKFEDDLNTSVSVQNHEAPELVSDTSCDNLRKEEIINCTCGYMEEDGLMIQCDLCLCWQHGLCNNIDKECDVPEKYICFICTHPPRQRASQRFAHNTDWIKDGTLPSFSLSKPESENVKQQDSMLKRSHELVGSLLRLQMVIRSLRVKTHIATKPGHPKLYLWAKSWKNIEEKEQVEVKKEGALGPQPEAAIDESECRLRLLEHVEDYQNQMEDRLTSIQAQIAALESEDPDLATDETTDNYPITKQTVQMILRDLNTVKQVVTLAS